MPTHRALIPVELNNKNLRENFDVIVSKIAHGAGQIWRQDG